MFSLIPESLLKISRGSPTSTSSVKNNPHPLKYLGTYKASTVQLVAGILQYTGKFSSKTASNLMSLLFLTRSE